MKATLVKTIAGLTLAATALSTAPAYASAPAPITYTTELSATLDPCTDHDELCYTLESETVAWSLFDAYKVASTYADPVEAIYLGYFDTLPALDTYEGYVSDGHHYYVFQVTSTGVLTA